MYSSSNSSSSSLTTTTTTTNTTTTTTTTTTSPSASPTPPVHHHHHHHSLLHHHLHHVKPPASVLNCSPYEHQLLHRLLPRHITTEHVVFSHKTKVGGRSLYFFSPATRGGLTKPVFTTREKLTPLLDGPTEEEDEGSDSGSPGRRGSSVGGGTGMGRKGRPRDEISPGVVCTIKRIHLGDPACDLGVSVWRGRGPQRGLQGPQRPPAGTGPALLVEASQNGRRGGDGMAVAAGYSGEVMFLLPYSLLARADLEPRATEIMVQDAMLSCVSESVVWFVVQKLHASAK
ncbi:uncharacterized protein LOC135091241 isoform X1 [Scylla paramamosain]|uniref:uncharacterized protein LOC135091241 isoform X1 n=2 Tax=Scylla paramamosain TaxID=85552 RepID=UPI0030836EBB